MIRVGVLRGGTSNKYDESLASGAYILKHLPRDKYEPVDIFIDREGGWHIGGAPITHDKLQRRVDVIWNALHGFYGEDGKAAQLLENLGVPYTGASPLAAAVAMSKKLSKDHFSKIGLKTPRGLYIEDWGVGEQEETVASVVASVAQKFSPPWIIEPISRGHGNGHIRAKTRDELMTVLLQMFDAGIPVLVEEAVMGREVCVSAVAGFRGQPIYTFPALQKENREARLKPTESEELQKIAKAIHGQLHLGQYSRMHAILNPKGHVYVVGVETMPETHEGADLHHSLASVGSSFNEFIEHIINEAMKKN